MLKKCGVSVLKANKPDMCPIFKRRKQTYFLTFLLLSLFREAVSEPRIGKCACPIFPFFFESSAFLSAKVLLCDWFVRDSKRKRKSALVIATEFRVQSTAGEKVKSTVSWPVSLYNYTNTAAIIIIIRTQFRFYVWYDRVKKNVCELSQTANRNEMVVLVSRPYSIGCN